ncbi:hypothetical protein SAMN02745166_04563 [Prosthecobacter debontii]|uniref:Uncharacterized protein n=1 Tax=Prosthecobacter debontii TaxID=48467 RepID=A0A1T4Z036_9BACT|nr:hypothetical protein [Prosthecobacter debontii]SKB06865.1 hypothetical protein SAMN02745166_04563 [Prosthecobacter debontii]
MSLSHLLIAACAVLTLASCESTGRVDAVNPTVSELDRLDTQWGLQPRRSRGAPKRTYQYSAPSSNYSMPASPAASASAPARETLNTAPPATPTPQLDPATVNSLR